MRALTEKFINDLTSPTGLLHRILERVKQDHTLMLAIRSNYINIYYRGGNILQVTEQSNGSYKTFFNKEYDKSGKAIPVLPDTLKTEDDVKIWVNHLSKIKEIMDIYFSEKDKPEREFQQLAARENNNSTISNESEYFISDIEFNDASIGARFDMLAIRWRTADRKNGNKCRAAFIEMKYGDYALEGKSGLLDHLEDIDRLISDRDKYRSLLEIMELQFNQLNELGLLRFNESKGTKVKLTTNDKPEVIFILANHNPRSKVLKYLLEQPAFRAFESTDRFDLRFFISSFAGYGLHSDCMLTLTQFVKFLIETERRCKNSGNRQISSKV